MSWPDPTHREVCCLSGSLISGITGKFPGLVQPSNYTPLLVVKFGSDKVVEKSLRAIQWEFRALGLLVEGVRAQDLFSLILSVAEKNTERSRKTHLRSWCHWRNFGDFFFNFFFPHGVFYSALDLLVTDGVYMSQRGKRIVAHDLAQLIERPLN